MTAAPTGPGPLISAVLTRADQEISDAEAGIRYAAEVNQGVLLASEEARADAWRTVRTLLAAPTGPDPRTDAAVGR